MEENVTFMDSEGDGRDNCCIVNLVEYDCRMILEYAPLSRYII